MTSTRTCRMPDCAKVANTHGLCTTHLGRLRRTGDPATDGLPKERIERLWSRFRRVESGCWEWQGRLNENGYGTISWREGGRQRWANAHRALYAILVGPVDADLQLDHLCRNRSCVNPSHLEPVTAKENQRRSPFSGIHRSHCPRGHAYDAANTYVSKTGHRRCRVCHRERVAASKSARTAA